jgi:hypothetical protein
MDLMSTPQQWMEPPTRQKALSYAPSPTQYSSAPGASGARRSFSALPTHSSSGGLLSSSVSSAAPAAAAGPALVAVRADLADIIEKGRSTFSALKEYKANAKKFDADGRLVSLVNKLWYRLGFLISAKYVGAGSDLQKEQLMLLGVLCEVRQTMFDLFDHQKTSGEKLQTILTRHAWLFTAAQKVEEFVSSGAMRLAQAEGSRNKSSSSTLAMPQLLEAPLTLFEDRLGIFSSEQMQSLFDESGSLKSLRSQVESYLNQGYEPALVSLFVTEAVGKAASTVMMNKDRRKLYFSALLSTYSCCRANSWILLLTNHAIDLGKLSDTKLTVSAGSNIAAAGTSAAAGAGGVEHAQTRRVSTFASAPGPSASMTTADKMRDAAGVTGTSASTGGSVRALPTDQTYRSMLDGLLLTGYFANGPDEVVVQRMQVWMDLAEGGSAKGSVPAVQGKKVALYYAPDHQERVQTPDCMLPISSISEILLGKQTTVLQSPAAARANSACCVTLVTSDGYSLNFEASTPAELAGFMGDVTKLCNATGKSMKENDGRDSNQQHPPLPPPSFSSQNSGVAAPPLLSSTSTAGAPTSPPLLSSTLAQHGASPPLLSATNRTSGLQTRGFDNGGWVKSTSPEGHVYFYHAGRNESVWEKPDEFQDFERPPPPAAEARRAIEF